MSLETSCKITGRRSCHCTFSSRMISILFLTVVESSYTIQEERWLRRVTFASVSDDEIGGSATPC